MQKGENGEKQHASAIQERDPVEEDEGTDPNRLILRRFTVLMEEKASLEFQFKATQKKVHNACLLIQLYFRWCFFKGGVLLC